METSASATVSEKQEAKSGLLEAAGFPDLGKKASPLVVAAAAAVVVAQGPSLSLTPSTPWLTSRF
uniref:GLI2 n=1 Tax=Callithrix jacchus TaxID=9483 RepID=A0A8I3X6L4_CALJA